MRVHPISLALRYLKGQRTMQAGPYYGNALFESDQAAAECLRKFTGQDFGTDAAAWGAWLRQNRWVYHARPDDPRLPASEIKPEEDMSVMRQSHMEQLLLTVTTAGKENGSDHNQTLHD